MWVMALVLTGYSADLLSGGQASRLLGMLPEDSLDADLTLNITRHGWTNGGLLMTSSDAETTAWITWQVNEGRATSDGKRLKVVGKEETERNSKL